MEKLGTQAEISDLQTQISRDLSQCRDAVLSRLDRGLRRTVLTLGTLMVVAGATVVLLV